MKQLSSKPGSPGGRLFQHYMHLTGVRAYKRSADGAVFLDALSARDLSRHTYLGTSVRVVCPVTTVTDPPVGYEVFDEPNFEFVSLPHATNLAAYVLRGGWLRAVLTMWRQLGWADVAFLGFVEHPIPYGWTAAPFAAIRRVPWYTFIESSPWRVPGSLSNPRWRDRLRAAIAEPLNRMFFRRAAFAFVSHVDYVDFLRADCPHAVSPATWFLKSEMASPAEIEAARARAQKGPPHLLYVGRLDPSKGIGDLLAAIAILDEKFGAVTDHSRTHAELLKLTVMGDGQLRPTVERAAAARRWVKLAVASPVPYGPSFLERIRGADAVVIPNLGDEQPRIVFDAFSQGVPVLAFDTAGLRSVVSNEVTGRLIPTGDAKVLASAMEEFLDPVARLRWHSRGDSAYEIAASYDHDEMHAQRAAFVAGLRI